MRVLLLAEVLHPETVGGAGRVVRELAEHLARSGHDVTLVARAGASRAAPPSGVRLIRVPPPRPFAPAAMWAYRAAVRCAIPDERFDVVHHHQPLIGWAAASVGRRGGAPPARVASFYSSWPAEFVVKHRRRLWARVAALPLAKIERAALEAADEWIVLSEHSRRELFGEVFGADRTRIRPTTKIPGGVDVERFRPATPPQKVGARMRFRLPQEAFVLLTVRNLVPRMGLSNLLAGFAPLAARDGAVHLVVAGDGPLRGELALRARALRLEGRVTFLGRLEEDELPFLYHAADLFVLPTEALEGFGLVILEAFASGVPVAATPVGAIPELVNLAGRGFLFDGTDAVAIERGLASVLARRDEFESLAPRLREIAEDHTWSRHAARVAEVYERARRARNLAV